MPPSGDTIVAPSRRRSELPQITIRPHRGWGGIDVREIWRFRDLLGILGGRDLKVRYKQTALGVSWVVLQPLIAAGIFSFVFGGIAKLEAPGQVPYFVFSFTGMLLWQTFATTLNRAGGSMVSNQHLVAKIYFPRLILPISTVFSALVDFAVGLGLLVVLLALFWQFPGWHVLMLPVCLLMLLTLAMGTGFAAAALAVPYRDVNYLRPVAIQFLLYASPVAYAVAEVPAGYRHLYMLNPIAPILETTRWAVLGTGTVPWGYLGIAAVVCAVSLVVGAAVFTRMERNFADVI
ncbi:MAG: ABC transporter permease [Candidatus Krumholzibacteriia bacterium]